MERQVNKKNSVSSGNRADRHRANKGQPLNEVPPRPLLAYLQALQPSLNPTERLICERILEDPERILSSSISELRRNSGASVGSIVSFCRTLGTTGFADFKISLARELVKGGFPTAPEGFREGPSSRTEFQRVFQFHSHSLEETLQLNSEESFQKAFKLLEAARKIVFFSIGMAYPVAYTACTKLQLIGLPATTQMDSHLQLIMATELKKGEVAFGISCSGTTRETVQCMQIAREKKATTISITNCLKSPITTYSDHVLYASPSEIKYFQAPLASRITQLAIVDALFVSIAQRHKTRTMAHLQRAGEQLLEYRI